MTSDLTATLEALDWAIALCDFEKRSEYGASLQSLRDRLDAAEPVADVDLHGFAEHTTRIYCRRELPLNTKLYLVPIEDPDAGTQDAYSKERENAQ